MNSRIIIHSLIAALSMAANSILLHADTSSQDPDSENQIVLYYSDGLAPSYGIEAVNRKLSEVGVRVSQIPIPEAAKPILSVSEERALSNEEAETLIRVFHLGRRELVEEILRAGRQPEMRRGGYLQTSEIGVSPYPKVYDMKALDTATTVYLQHKFGKLHVNSSDAGVGIDEVMTIVSGGPYTWFFGLDNNVVGKLRFGTVNKDGKAWRISYPGLVPHGGFFDARHGLVVAYAHGPKHFVMRYEAPFVKGFELLGDNPWVDFDHENPELLMHLQQYSLALNKH